MTCVSNKYFQDEKQITFEDDIDTNPPGGPTLESIESVSMTYGLIKTGRLKGKYYIKNFQPSYLIDPTTKKIYGKAINELVCPLFPYDEKMIESIGLKFYEYSFLLNH